jgi:predicted phage terminase large subunit-like protein
VSSVNRDPDWTVGVLMSRLNDDRIVIEHVTRLRKSAGQVAQHIVATAREDGRDVIISIPQDPGQAGKSQRDDLQQRLHGYRTVSKPETGDKVTRAGPFSSATEQGRVLAIRGHWLHAWMTELENFPIGRHKDDMDATSGGFNELMGKTLKGGTWGREQEKELTGRTALLAGPPLRMMGGRRR